MALPVFMMALSQWFTCDGLLAMSTRNNQRFMLHDMKDHEFLRIMVKRLPENWMKILRIIGTFQHVEISIASKHFKHAITSHSQADCKQTTGNVCTGLNFASGLNA